jgi:PKD repeat protein
LRVTDADGLTSTAATTVRVLQPPTAVAGGPYTVVAGQSATLDGSASTDDAAATLAYAWDLDNDDVFGEAGEVGVNPTFSAVGKAAGTYMVSLRVTDADGLTSTATTTINVITSVEFTTQVVATVSQQVTALADSGILTTSQADSMQSKLDSARAALERDNTTAAANQIAAAIFQIEAILNQKKTAQETRTALTSLESELAEALSLL